MERKRPSPADAEPTSPRRVTRSFTLQRVMEVNGLDEMLRTAQEQPLYKAALSGDKQAVELALRHANSFTKTAVLHSAVYYAPAEAWRMLIEAGAPLAHAGLDCSVLGVLLVSPRGVPDLETVRYLVEKGAPINQTNFRELSPLFVALSTPQRAEVVEFLLASGADANAVSRESYTPLLAAVASSTPNTLANIRALLRAGANPNDPRSIVSPLSLCLCASDTLEKMRILIEHGCDVSRATRSLPPLHIAAHSGRLDAAQLLVQAGAPIDALWTQTEGGQPLSPLEMAVVQATDSYDLIRLLAVPSATSPHRLAPLLTAPLTSGRFEMLRALLDSAIDFAEVLRTHSFLQIATQHECPLWVIELLIARGARVDQCEETNRVTPLQIAAKHGRCDIARLLISLGADVNARDWKGRTALQRAAHYEETDSACLVEALLEQGADPNVADTYRFRTPLHWAAHRGMENTVRTLLQYGAQQTRDVDALRPADLAAGLGYMRRAFDAEIIKTRLP